MPALTHFTNQTYRWYAAGNTRHCHQARVPVYRRQLDRFGPDAVKRHVRRTARALDRAEAVARLAASQERNRG